MESNREAASLPQRTVSCEFSKVWNFRAYTFSMFSPQETPSTVEIKPRVPEQQLTCVTSDQ